MERKDVSVVITDLDNTLFDWVEVWYQSFSSMLEELSRSSGVDREELEKDFKRVHQRHGTSEYAFALQELESLQHRHPGEEVEQIYAGAIQAYREARRASLRLYPTVQGTLQRLKDVGCLLIAYTESMEFYTKYRVRKLDLDLVLDVLYSPQDHQLPEGLSRDEIRFYPRSHYQYRHTRQEYTPAGMLKPSVEILLGIIDQVGASRAECIYVGDSLMKDVAMARSANITSVWAKYGAAQHREEYELLRRVTHWRQEDVEREKRIRQQHVDPEYVADKEFGEILSRFDFNFIPFEGAVPAKEGRE